MMPGPGEIFEQSKYLMMYSDNKTVDSKNIKIEVHLTKKNEQVNRRIKMDPIDETLKKESVYRVILMYNFSNYFID